MSDTSSLPRENLIRALMPGIEYQDTTENGTSSPTLFGHFARFDEWTEINSLFEGRFMERFAPGAFKKTLREQRDRLRVLFQHGQDPEIGDKPIAAVEDVREDDEGAYYEARLFDGLPPLVMEGLRAGQYGASFRFSVMREDFNDRAAVSEHNPLGLPERTVKEAKVPEFGPVTFPAYAGASAGIRSLTDDFLLSCIRQNPEGAREMLDRALSLKDITPQSQQTDTTPDVPAEEPEQDAPSEEHAEPDAVHLPDERREDQLPEPGQRIYGMSRKETSQPWRL